MSAVIEALQLSRRQADMDQDTIHLSSAGKPCSWILPSWLSPASGPYSLHGKYYIAEAVFHVRKLLPFQRVKYIGFHDLNG